MIALQTLPPSITADPALVNPRLLGSSETAVIAALLLLIYAYRRRRYILWWTWGWCLLSVATLVTMWPSKSQQVLAVAFGLAQFLRILSGLVFVVAADAYRRTPDIKRTYLLLLLPVAIWFTLSPAALGTTAVFAPGYVLIAGGMAAAGAAHLLLARQARLRGALIVGLMMIGIAALNGWFATLAGLPEGPSSSAWLVVRMILYLLAGLGMQLMAFEDMTFELRVTNKRLESAQADLREMVITDPLTGTRNRRFFHEIIGRELQRHRRYRAPLSIVFIDVDRFKAINDTLGHDAGDRVLRHVASFLLRNIREADYVFRWGGDEFLILISCGEAEAIVRARDLQHAFAAAPQTAALPTGVALSIGCVEVPPNTEDILPLIQKADEEMYRDKKRRR